LEGLILKLLQRTVLAMPSYTTRPRDQWSGFHLRTQ